VDLRLRCDAALTGSRLGGVAFFVPLPWPLPITMAYVEGFGLGWSSGEVMFSAGGMCFCTACMDLCGERGGRGGRGGDGVPRGDTGTLNHEFGGARRFDGGSFVLDAALAAVFAVVAALTAFASVNEEGCARDFLPAVRLSPGGGGC